MKGTREYGIIQIAGPTNTDKEEIRMRLKTARTTVFAACALAAVCLALFAVTKNAVFGYLTFVVILAGAIFWLIFGKCSSCGKFIGRTDTKYCPHCGERINW